ncbi:MAG: teichoic acid ABC transporter permease [Desulfobacterales bacterium CG23_combo_of_CG06-09_8_20_14_all_51_8]|nr:MAG: teichoic acid ABC transporter permease [Desulfobacterales bacterium CG23_combo_of_CG06-09_8_20_14_all_51_8]
MKKYIQEMMKRKDLMIYLVLSGLKSQNKNSFLGYFWWLLDPLLSVGIYYFVVVIVFRRAHGAGYGVYLVIGMIVWRWLSSTVLVASKSISQQSGIISQVNLPKIQFPICVALTQLINFGFGLIIIGLFLIYFRVLPGIELLWLPVVMGVQFLFMLALALPVAFVSVFIRDVEAVIGHLMRLWFFGSPVIWYTEMIPERGKWLLAINPMTHLLNGYRSIFSGNGDLPLHALLSIGIASVGFIFVMIYIYYRWEYRIIKVL